MKGIIALDIDGTVTEAFHSVPQEVVAYLATLVDAGWKLVFITGRTYKWGYSILKNMNFPYTLAVQNGAIILDMPSGRLVKKKYLDKSICETMDDICKDERSDYVIYSGYEYNDICYYRPAHFSADMLEYLRKRITTLGETYQAVSSFANLSLTSFPSIKCFGDYSEANRIAEKMEKKLSLHVTPVRDPFNDKFLVAQATHPQTSKGYALNDIKKIYPEQRHLVISAGNDYNDVSMFAESDLTIVMGNAPADLLDKADIKAPPASEMGIIDGLKQAIDKCQKNSN